VKKHRKRRKCSLQESEAFVKCAESKVHLYLIREDSIHERFKIMDMKATKHFQQCMFVANCFYSITWYMTSGQNIFNWLWALGYGRAIGRDPEAYWQKVHDALKNANLLAAQSELVALCECNRDSDLLAVMYLSDIAYCKDFNKLGVDLVACPNSAKCCPSCTDIGVDCYNKYKDLMDKYSEHIAHCNRIRMRMYEQLDSPLRDLFEDLLGAVMSGGTA